MCFDAVYSGAWILVLRDRPPRPHERPVRFYYFFFFWYSGAGHAPSASVLGLGGRGGNVARVMGVTVHAPHSCARKRETEREHDGDSRYRPYRYRGQQDLSRTGPLRLRVYDALSLLSLAPHDVPPDGAGPCSRDRGGFFYTICRVLEFSCVWPIGRYFT